MVAVVVVVIRTASLSDLDVVRDVYRRSSLHNERDRANLLAHPEVLVLSEAAVAEGRTRVATIAGGQIVGFVSILSAGTTVELDDLFVAPEWMGQGIGRELVLDVVANAGAFTRVEVTANPHAVAFYQKVGFTMDFEVETQFGPAPRMHRDLTATSRQMCEWEPFSIS